MLIVFMFYEREHFVNTPNSTFFSYEVELGKVVSQVHNVLGSSLDLLIKYGSVWVHYPADHLAHHRLAQQQGWLTSLLQEFTLNK